MGVLDVSGKKALVPTSNLAPGRHRATRVVHGDEALGEPVKVRQCRVRQSRRHLQISRNLDNHRNDAGPNQIAMNRLGTLLIHPMLHPLIF